MKYLIILASLCTITNALREDGGRALAQIYMTSGQVLESDVLLVRKPDLKLKATLEFQMNKGSEALDQGRVMYYSREIHF
ncbi:MAG: hypothetical protein ACOYL6_02415 [Bacteriovoracaceae bacterium]